MPQSDARLIQQVLQGDQDASTQSFGKKISEGGSLACVAENR